MTSNYDYSKRVSDAMAAGLTLTGISGGAVTAVAGNWDLGATDLAPWIWVARPILGWGMPLAHAIYLHETPMPCAKFGLNPSIAGQIIRAEGCTRGLHPTSPYFKGTETITLYHIDTAAGLRIFADYVQRPGLSDAVIHSAGPVKK